MASGRRILPKMGRLRSSSNAEASNFPPPPHSLSLLPCASPSSSCSHPQHCLLLTMTLYCFPNSVWELDMKFWILSRSSRKVKVRAGKKRSVVSIHLGFDWQPLSQEKPRFIFRVLRVHKTMPPSQLCADQTLELPPVIRSPDCALETKAFVSPKCHGLVWLLMFVFNGPKTISPRAFMAISQIKPEG